MNTENIEERARHIVTEHLGIDGDRVVPEANFIDDMGADSLDHIELIMAFEEEFGIEISDADAEKITTFASAVTYIEGKV